MDERRAWRSLAVVTMLFGIAAAVTIASCGGSGGSSNGQLCEQCGDTDGPCDAAGADITADQTQPVFCPNRNGTGQPAGATNCHAKLVCTRKVDSSQRRCFPADPATGGSDPNSGELDLRYECDGSRPGGTPAPTTTPTPTPTATPTNTAATPTSTSATPTGPTPTSATPTATATPGGPEDVDVTIDVSTSDSSDVPSTFAGAVTYPTTKGTFTPLDDCTADDGLTVTDAGNGTLLLSFSSSDTSGIDTVNLSCPFHQLANQTLENADLHPSVNPSTLEITASLD